jgi:hypothetical protein
MKLLSYLAIALWMFAALGLAENESGHTTLLQGWLSDEQCARGRASSGIYTGTNPECANECVAKGKKIVFIDPAAKRILLIANQDVAKEHVGDRVEITGSLNPQAKSIHVVSLKMLEKGAAMCARPTKGQ